MKNKKLSFENFSISVSENWNDITDSLEDSQAPLTIGDKEKGHGVLQISSGIYGGGIVPEISLREIEKMLVDFAVNRQLGDSLNHESLPGPTVLTGATFHSGDDLVEVWYATNGKSVILATYVSDWEDRFKEAEERKLAFTSILFED